MERHEIKNLARECVEGLSDFDLIQTWNYYCDENCYDEHIYDMCDLVMFLEGMEPLKIVDEFTDVDHFKTYDRYFFIDIHGYHSFDYCSDELCPIDISDLVRFIVDNEDDCDNDELKDVFEYIKEYDSLGDDDEEDEEED